MVEAYMLAVEMGLALFGLAILGTVTTVVIGFALGGEG